MADPKENDPSRKFDNLIDNQEKKVFDNKGKGTPPSPPSTDDNKAPDEPFDLDKGAYGIDFLNTDVYGNRKKKESSTPTSSGGGIKAPKHPDAPKSGGGGKNVMDVFWNDFIVPAYTSCISGAVNLTMSFMDYVLFNAYIPQTPQKKKEEEKNDIWSICSKVYEKYKKTAEKGMGVFSLAHKELMENIEKAKLGLAPSWKVWPGKKAPMFFNEFVELSKKAETDPNSPEAEKWKKITSMPELMEGLFRKEIHLRKLAISMAGMEVALATEKYTLPKEISKVLKDMKDLKSYEIEEKYKEEMKAKISKLKELIKEDTSVNKELGKQLGEIEKYLDDPKKDLKAKIKSINEKLADMKDIKPFAQEAEIDEKSQKYYDAISQNIEKIKTLYAGNPEKAAETIDNYLKSMKEATEPALSSVDRYIKSTRLSRAMNIVGKKINVSGGKIGKRISVSLKQFRGKAIPVEDIEYLKSPVIIEKMKEAAERRFQSSVASISNFSADGRNLDLQASADKPSKSPFADDKHGPFTLYNKAAGR